MLAGHLKNSLKRYHRVCHGKTVRRLDFKRKQKVWLLWLQILFISMHLTLDCDHSFHGCSLILYGCFRSILKENKPLFPWLFPYSMGVYSLFTRKTKSLVIMITPIHLTLDCVLSSRGSSFTLYGWKLNFFFELKLMIFENSFAKKLQFCL